ncbi:MAG: phospholipid/cholesterol/gamma-HCH transport system substrate-binding protein [Solirubrobacteraceae bacterium]|nr:phospholipid/cholesterol/gamma-HCH transport system substrate-binding protein [Solirubrobacteraceae bacterium]
MNKSAPGVGRIAAMVIFTMSCFGLLLFLWLAFGGPIPLKPQGYRFHTSFAEAGQLAKEADVRISGVPVGKVKDIVPDKRTGKSDVVIELQPRYAPLPRDARAILRQKTLLGETYVELTPGTRGSGGIPEGGTLAAGQVGTTVELDEILRTFDAPTRRAFQSWMQDQAVAIKGHGRDLNDALGNLGPFAEDASRMVDILNSHEGAVSRLISNTGVIFAALTERDGQLRSLIENANRVFATTASRDRQLQEAFVALPTFERESRATVQRLTAFAKNADPLVTQLRPAARELSPTLQDLKAISPDLRTLFVELQPLIDASKRGFPAAQKVLRDLRPLIAQLDPSMRQVTPILDFIGLYKPELTAFFANTAATTQARDPGTNLHYLRTVNPLNRENLAVQPRRLGTNRTNPYAKPGAFNDYARGLASFETRHCGRALPAITNTPPPDLPGGGTPPLPVPLPSLPLDQVTQQLQSLVPQQLLDALNRFAAGPANEGAPPCRWQGPYKIDGETSQYPHVKAR